MMTESKKKVMMAMSETKVMVLKMTMSKAKVMVSMSEAKVMVLMMTAPKKKVMVSHFAISGKPSSSPHVILS